MSATPSNDFFKKFISKSDYQTQIKIRDLMEEMDAYTTPLPKAQRTNKTYLRQIHRDFFSQYPEVINDCEYSNNNLQDNIDELHVALEQIFEDIRQQKQQEYNEHIQQELKDFDEMLNEIDEEIHRKQEEIDRLKQIKREEINKVRHLGIEMRQNPPPPPQPLPKYINSNDYIKRHTKDIVSKIKVRNQDVRFAKDDSTIVKERKYFKPIDPNTEANEFIAKNNNNTQLYSFNDNVMWVNEPEEYDDFMNVFEHTMKLMKTEEYVNSKPQEVENEPVCKYFLNKFSSFNDVFKYIDDVIYKTERKPFKIWMSFGSITEEKSGVSTVKYHKNSPYENDADKRIPITVKDAESLNLFKKYIISYLQYDIQERNRRVSLEKVICYYNVMFKVYRLSKSGAKIPGLETFIRNKYIRVYTEDDNFCMFASLAYHKLKTFKDNTKAKQAARKYFCEFYNLDYNPHQFTNATKEAFRNYPGFDIASELENFSQHFNLNTRIWEFNNDKNQYYLANELFTGFDASEFNILIVSVGAKSHVMYISNIEALTGLLFCPKCKDLICRKDSKNCDKTFKNHVNKCDGKPGVHKELKLDLQPQPYVPHILKNKEYMEALAYGKENEYTPINYYITYDFETVECPLTYDSTATTQIKASLHPISIASVIHIPPMQDKILYFDIRDGEDFIMKWIDQLISELKNTDITFINVIGYNSAKFDINLLIPELSKRYEINSLLGSATTFKQVSLTSEGITLRFIDAMLFVSPGPLKQFVKDFGSEGCSEKGVFPYEAITIDNYNEVLSKSEPFEQSDFHSELNQTDMSDKDYEMYLEDAKTFDSRWDYLRYYNILDVEAMISPLDNLIKLFWEHKIDMLKNLSLSANASAIKYAKCYDDFDINADYSVFSNDSKFIPTKDWFKMKCRNYTEQDIRAKRDVSKNISEADWDAFNKMYYQDCRCYLCNEKFTYKNQPTFDRIDNKLPHRLDNLRFACKYCNCYRADNDEKITKLKIQLRKYCLLNDLPMTLCNKDKDVYKILRDGITGGLSNVMHRVNIKGETKINKFRWNNELKQVESYDTDYTMTHVCGVDFNSLYPSSYSSEYNVNNPYTEGKMYMPGKIEKHVVCNDEKKKQYARDIIMSKDRFNDKGCLFVAVIKGYIPEEYYNKFINFSPIFRRLNVKKDSDTIGEYMYNYLRENELDADTEEQKLTMLLSTHDQYMSFSSYYLWFLIDTCNFVIDDIESITLFTKHDKFNKFVKTFTNERIKNIGVSKGRELFCKTCLNGSYGYDAKNTEKYTKSAFKNKSQTFLAQIYNNFISTRKIDDDKYIITYQPRNFKCDTCIQEAYFTLDNAKFWYLNMYYNFLVKALDTDRFHYIESDTDSLYLAIAGNPDEGNDQMFKYIIKDQEFYDKHVFEWLPDPNKGVYDEKKILGMAVEKFGDSCIALCCKCYTVFNHDGTTKSLKLKGVSLKKNKIVSADYKKVIDEETIKAGRNISLQLKNGQMKKVFTNKNALTMAHSKMICLPNGSCAPFLFGVKASQYKVV